MLMQQTQTLSETGQSIADELAAAFKNELTSMYPLDKFDDIANFLSSKQSILYMPESKSKPITSVDIMYDRMYLKLQQTLFLILQFKASLIVFD